MQLALYYVAVVEAVLARDPIQFEQHEFNIRRMLPAPPVTVPLGPADPTRVLIRHIPSKCTIDEIKAFLSKHGHCKVNSVTHGLQPDVALVKFDGTPGKML